MPFRKKIYGQSRSEQCFFCGKNALHENSQKIPVCEEHKTSAAENVKCACGKTLYVRESKWGAFFVCDSCGPVSLKKAKENIGIEQEFNINKKFRKKQKEQEFDKEKIYTVDELETIFDNVK